VFALLAGFAFVGAPLSGVGAQSLPVGNGTPS